MNLERPLIIFDLETTGVNWRSDRIVELAALKRFPDGQTEERVWRINPEQPIPPGATAIHGICDADVAHCPTFKQLAPEILNFFAGSDLAGFNAKRFDLPLLLAECRRADQPNDLQTRRMVDAQIIFHRREPRDLSAALRFFCGTEHTDAHGALADVRATAQVLDAQLTRYPDLPQQVNELADWCAAGEPEAVDPARRFVWNEEGQIVCNFGKHRGRPLADLAAQEPGFLKWMLGKDFDPLTLELVRAALAGRLPAGPTPP